MLVDLQPGARSTCRQEITGKVETATNRDEFRAVQGVAPQGRLLAGRGFLLWKPAPETVTWL